MEQTWRWWGPKDRISLADICQIGAAGIVTALHEIPTGAVWTAEAIAERKRIIEADRSLGLRWAVVESVPVHESIKLAEAGAGPFYQAYRDTLRNLGEAGIDTVCYNFMPVLDWARTQLRHPLPGGATALRFNVHEFAAFDLCMLARPGAEADWAPEVVAQAKCWFAAATEEAKRALLGAIMAGLPGAFDRYDIAELRTMLARYQGVDQAKLRANLQRFLEEVVPTAEAAGVRLCIHPDDPPRPLLGLPRVTSTADDIAFILDAVPSAANGLTLCTGSLGARPANDLPAIAARFADRIHFVHLRNVRNEPDGSFMEADHLAGDTDMVAVVKVLLAEQQRREAAGDPHWRLPFRPDHGHEMLDDIGKPHHPGYSAIGRMRGLAEIRGVMAAVAKLESYPL
jgi:mannonate dehydratase